MIILAISNTTKRHKGTALCSIGIVIFGVTICAGLCRPWRPESVASVRNTNRRWRAFCNLDGNYRSWHFNIGYGVIRTYGGYGITQGVIT